MDKKKIVYNIYISWLKFVMLIVNKIKFSQLKVFYSFFAIISRAAKIECLDKKPPSLKIYIDFFLEKFSKKR